MPAPVQAFFDADRTAEGAFPADAFAPDATVRDEGKAHAGRDAIAAWWQAAKAAYGHSSKPCEIAEEGGTTIVLGRVTGRFPGSPAMLSFAFRLHDGRIAALEIGA
ncbi:nuclear transport factor 2 family protein [Marinibaculum pumilum]|uniref:Nuclear transport factor 2 family protein n=1 Tax=Marinibaculum pumilum TaxID=1766165 RepID=A0ABV7L0A6_9PROT